MTTRAFATDPDAVCPQCVKADGLCGYHGKQVLPQLAQPFWHRLVGATHYDMRREESAEGRKVRERKERKRARAQDRLLLAIAGVHTRSRKAAA